MALRAFYEQENNFGVVDRIEIYDEEFTGTAIQFEGRFPCAFDFEHREITSEQKEYLSLFKNQIIMGVLDLFLRVDSADKKQVVIDVADAQHGRFKLEWKRNGVMVWVGYPYGRIVEFDEYPNFNVKIQFRDFEFLKGEDYPLDYSGNDREKLINYFREIANKITLIGANYPIRTMTSWEAENTVVGTDDFLNQVYYDKEVLREYAGDGYSEDQPISYYGATERIVEPMLVLYQWKGFNVVQISALKNAESVYTSEYNLLGQISSGLVNRKQDIFTSTDLGVPSAKVSTGNASYPALRRAFYEYRHRSGSSQFEFDITGDFQRVVDFGESDLFISSKQYAGNGDEKLSFTSQYSTTNGALKATYAVHVGVYALDSDYQFKTAENHTGYASNGISSINTTNGRLNLFADLYKVGDPVMLYSTGNLPTGIEADKAYYIVAKNDTEDWIQVSETPDGSVVVPSDQGTGDVFVRVIKIEEETESFLLGFRSLVSFTSSGIPMISGATMEVILMKVGASTDGEQWGEPFVFIQNPTQAGESLEFRLTQDEIYPDELELRDSYFGDGPYPYSRSSYRRGLALNTITTGWRRRGETPYVPYSQLKLREVLDFQRKRQLKKHFDIYGEFDPVSVSVYDGDTYMYVGGSYNGRWRPICVKVEENLDV